MAFQARESLQVNLTMEPFKTDDPSNQEENWLAWLENPSKSDLEMIAAMDERDRRVGALLRELHYLATSEPPRFLHLSLSEDDYWIGSARMCPGYQETKLLAELTRRRNESSTPATAQ